MHVHLYRSVDLVVSLGMGTNKSISGSCRSRSMVCCGRGIPLKVYERPHKHAT